MTVSAVLSLLSGIFGLIRYIITRAERNEWIKQGDAELLLKVLQDSDNAISEANKARETVAADIAADPGKLRDDDGFQRRD